MATTATLVRTRDEGRATWFVNGLAVTKAASGETAGAYALAEHLVTADSNPPVHVHVDEEEAFYVLDGEVEFEVDGAATTARTGTYVLVSRGAAHTFRVLTETARMLVITSTDQQNSQGGFERLVELAGSPAAGLVLPVPSAPDPVALTAAAAECGIVILPPEQV